MFLFLSMCLMTMATMFMFLNHPLSMGLILLIQTVLTALVTGLMNLNFWYSYILFLIMIGGMLILFIYMTSIASNEKFKFSLKLMLIMLSYMLLMMMIIIMDHYFFSFDLNNLDLFKQDYNINYQLSLSKYFNYPNNMIVYTMIIYLLITLIMVVKITNISYGPMRQMY